MLVELSVSPAPDHRARGARSPKGPTAQSRPERGLEHHRHSGGQKNHLAYPLIAGTYTPLLTISLNSVTATVLLIVIWSAAVAGVIFKAFFAGRFKWFSVSTYLAMGWSAVFVIYELFLVMAPPGFLLLLVGGAAYSIGVIFYVTKAIAFNHAIWHCFVLIGALSHCWLILEYVVNGSQM